MNPLHIILNVVNDWCLALIQIIMCKIYLMLKVGNGVIGFEIDTAHNFTLHVEHN